MYVNFFQSTLIFFKLIDALINASIVTALQSTL